MCHKKRFVFTIPPDNFNLKMFVELIDFIFSSFFKMYDNDPIRHGYSTNYIFQRFKIYSINNSNI